MIADFVLRARIKLMILGLMTTIALVRFITATYWIAPPLVRIHMILPLLKAATGTTMQLACLLRQRGVAA